MLEEFFRDEKLLQSFAKHYQTGETLPSETIRNEAGRRLWPRRLGALAALLHHPLARSARSGPRRPRSRCDHKQLYESLQPWTWLEGNRMYASFGHLTGYSSNYYTYAFDKVIALDFFAQFDAADLLGCEAGAAIARPCSNKAARSPAGRWCATSSAATRSFRPSQSGSTKSLKAAASSS